MIKISQRYLNHLKRYLPISGMIQIPGENTMRTLTLIIAIRDDVTTGTQIWFSRAFGENGKNADRLICNSLL